MEVTWAALTVLDELWDDGRRYHDLLDASWAPRPKSSQPHSVEQSATDCSAVSERLAVPGGRDAHYVAEVVPKGDGAGKADRSGDLVDGVVARL